MRIDSKTGFGHATELFGKLSPSKWSNVTLHEADSVAIVLSGGGGWGFPYEREPNAVISDVVSGFVSTEAARDIYGVVLDPEKMTIDSESTEKLREKMKVNGPKLLLAPHVKILQSVEMRFGDNLKPKVAAVSDMTGLVALSESDRCLVVKIEAANYEDLISRTRDLVERLGANKTRVLTTQFVPMEFHRP